ncbi:Hypothetical protein MBVG_2700 [Mycoplasmopsis bovigenitalium 51080]|uniref:Uncharacterized protein n=1 Tax=Mycoplasmopsis bovigenitalium 51080 TaxID=1188235 RepID=N9VEM0_9BACT|nr:hypothetical protein [Mycoplasmopsis bovigenitalium]ENY69861.1 Hypothetical protein MBVG_2700 [Mycoplasmopsis bovigenitalium 51080]
MQFDKFTPYMPEHSMLFNVYGQPIKEHPVVIWYNGNDDMYYFVKARSASKKGIIRDKLPTEILIPASATNSDSLFFKDSLLDCSQIFRMRSKDFELAYGKSNYPEIDQLPFNYAMQIITEIQKNFKNDHISLMNVRITGYNDKQEPIIEPELLYASKSSFEQEEEWWQKLIRNNETETINKANAFVANYHQTKRTRVKLNPVDAGIDIAKEELMVDRIYTPIYHYMYDKELLDKGYNVVEIIDLVKKDIFNTEEFKDYKVFDADVWGSLTLPWGKRRTSLNFVEEYRINSDKLNKIQQNHFFFNVKDNELLEFKKAYENESLTEWIDKSYFSNEFKDCKKEIFASSPIEEIAAWFIKARYCVENTSIIDEELEKRNLLNQNSQEPKQQIQKRRTMRM